MANPAADEVGSGVAGEPGPRQKLLERAVEHLSESGMSDISLRALAAALGTSHRMLIYHFGSKEELFVEVALAAEERQREVLGEIFESFDWTPAEGARQFWVRLRSPDLAPLERLFFELYSQGLQGRPHALRFLDGIVDSWVDATAPALEAIGQSPQAARAEARLGLAVVRGLLLDVLATGDITGVDEAFERHLASIEAVHDGTH